MIRSVSRYAVEISKPDSPFFERVICFVKPQYADDCTINLHKEIEDCISQLNMSVESNLSDCAEDKPLSARRVGEGKFGVISKYWNIAASAVAGGVITAVIMALVVGS
ncbi:MAG: hypothetical protein LBL82_00490 [Oscillospiraceae bacterium]|jgi:hypothetical protein|nr:hypothetical protein [Oscillospiraceae bacterium]